MTGASATSHSGLQVGYWGPRTSSNDFCEDNYAVSHYVAEFWNTLSSFAIVFYGLFGVFRALQYRYHTRFILLSASLSFVGIGSVAFHGTLLREGQMLDELPMIYGCLLLIYGTLVLDSKNGTISKWIVPGMIAYALAFTTIYVYFPEYFWFFVTMYVVGSFWQIWKAFEMMKDPSVPRASRILAGTRMYLDISIFLLLWLPEHLVCEYVKWIHPHALFHVLAGASVHSFGFFIVFESYRRQVTQLKAKKVKVEGEEEGAEEEVIEKEKESEHGASRRRAGSLSVAAAVKAEEGRLHFHEHEETHGATRVRLAYWKRIVPYVILDNLKTS